MADPTYYASVADVRLLFGTEIGATDYTDKINNALKKANSIIDASLGSRYVVPFTTVPPLVNTIAAEIAGYYLLRTIFLKQTDKKNYWIETFRSGFDLLKDIASGNVQLKSSTGADLAMASGGATSSTINIVSTFNLDDPENWEVDPTELEAIADERG